MPHQCKLSDALILGEILLQLKLNPRRARTEATNFLTRKEKWKKAWPSNVNICTLVDQKRIVAATVVDFCF